MVNMKAMLGKRAYCGQGEERDALLKDNVGKHTHETGATRSYLAAINKAHEKVPNFVDATSLGDVRARGLTTMTTCIGIAEQHRQEWKLYQRMAFFKSDRDVIKLDYAASLRRNARAQAAQGRRCRALVQQHEGLKKELTAA